jgi:hypothetical protein
MDELNVVDVPIGNPVGYPGKPPLDQGAMLRLLKGDHALRFIKVRQGTRSRITQTAFGYDGAGLPGQFASKDWTLVEEPSVLHSDVSEDVATKGYCYFQLVKG